MPGADSPIRSFDPKLPQLADVREIELKLTPGAMRPFLNYVTSKYRPLVTAPIAVVLDGSMDDAFCAGVFRFVCKLSDTEVFDDYALAIKWLLRDNWSGRNRRRYRSQRIPAEIRLMNIQNKYGLE